MKTYNFSAMNTNIQLGIERSKRSDEELLQQVQHIFEMVENACSRFLPDSELSRLNEQVGQEVALSPLLFSILQQAAKCYRETNGLFQPGVLAALEQEGYRQSIEQIRGQEITTFVSAPIAVATKLPYALDDKNITIVAEEKLDLGGIAKGWAVDYTAALLQANADGFINAGGDLCIFGQLANELTVGIEHPYIPGESMSSLSLSSGALATSSTAKRRWKNNGEWKHHLIDPRTGTSVNSRIVTVTVTAPTAVQADVWAKTVLLLGEEQGGAWIEQKGERAVWMNEFGEVWRVG
ncbi:FAD:protein FMN transferase [Bacillus sp. OTU530]|uniref:FAD:protein FMN transferase n=1 Tax=Bacillus sp. OTU530 TaxID=3043862 RepID=UPI00313B4A5E